MSKSQFLKSLLFFSFFVSLALNLYASDNEPTFVIRLYEQSSECGDTKISNDNDRGRRCPTHPIYCEIDLNNGLSFSGKDTIDVVGYELIDENGCILDSFTDESEFVEYLFSLQKPTEIRLYTDQYVYIGYIY